MDTKQSLRLLRTFALAALTAVATTACTDDNSDPAGNEPITPSGGIPVAFTADINPATRTVLTPDNGGFIVEWKGRDNNPDNGYDQIHIWAAKGTTVIPNSGGNIYIPTTSKASSALEPFDEGNKLTLTEAGDWKFTAIYGCGSTRTGEADVSISPLTQSAPDNTEHIAAADFSVAATLQTVEAGEMSQNISLGFEHKLSALQLHVTNETGAELTVKEIRLSVASEEIVKGKTYEIAAGNWKATGELKDTYLKLTASNFPALATGGASQDFHMLLFPEPDHSGKNMTITVITDRGEYTLKKPTPTGGFEAGTNYKTDITVKSSDLTASESWTEYIATADQLKAFRDRVNSNLNNSSHNALLIADINLNNEAWTPIGNLSVAFKGSFGGGGHYISDLNVEGGTSDYVGLFGSIDGGTVHNLRVSGTVTTSGLYAGGIAGSLNNGSVVENCIFSGSVSGNKYVGGIAGWSKGTTSRIAGCHTNGSIKATGNSNAGGIAGTNEGSVKDCYSSASVTAATSNVGGITGENKSGGTVTQCYATGGVSTRWLAGGISGLNDDGSVEHCLAFNPFITKTAGKLNTFGRITGRGSVINCAAFDGMVLPDNVPVTDDASKKDGAGLSVADCLASDTYTSREFTDVNGWAFDPSTPWTYLPWNKVFDSWGISVDTYRISVPAYLTGSSTN